MSPIIWQIDAFTASPFSGNPAAVCVLAGPADPAWMAAVARETGMPATAFVCESSSVFPLRWFTAATELVLCGHGTLAAAHLLYESGRVRKDACARFDTPDGQLTAVWKDGWIELNFPAIASTESPVPDGLLESLGVSPKDVRHVGRGRLDYLVEVADEEIVATLRPDLARMLTVKTRGVIVTSRSAHAERDFVSRFFAPSTGISEDSVTGSAHCCLTPYWASRLGKESLVAHQLSARGGVLRVAVDGDRVRLAGQAVTVMRGELATWTQG